MTFHRGGVVRRGGWSFEDDKLLVQALLAHRRTGKRKGLDGIDTGKGVPATKKRRELREFEIRDQRALHSIFKAASRFGLSVEGTERGAKPAGAELDVLLDLKSAEDAALSAGLTREPTLPIRRPRRGNTAAQGG